MNDYKLLVDMGRRVCERRKALHLTQEQMAEKMGVSIQMISNLEAGKKAVRPENLVKVSEVLEVSADYILTGRRSELELSELVQKFITLSEEHQHIIEQLINSL